MIAIKVLYYYKAASWASSLPALGLEVSASPGEVAKLLKSRGFLDAVVGKDAGYQFRQLLESESHWQLTRSAHWFALWLEALFSAAGIVQVLSPEVVSHRVAKDTGAWSVVLRCHCQASDGRLARALLHWSLDCWKACVAPRRPSDEVRSLSERLKCLVVGKEKAKASFLAMARDVHRRGLPLELDRVGGHRLLWVGMGANSQRISQKVTDQTSGWGLQCAKNKVFTRQLLQATNLPVAAGASVSDFDSALRVSEKLGYPVVSKPVAADQGQGVVTLIADSDTLRSAWQESSRHGSGVLVEKHIPGRDYRFLVIHGSLVAALERIPGGVAGDGIHSVEALIREENRRRGSARIEVEGGTTLSLRQIELNAEAEAMLGRQGLTPASIPISGQRVRLRYSANFSVGGSVRECLREVHPATQLMLEKVSRIFGLDIVGVDVIASEIREPLLPQGGVICEVNGMPGVLPHMLAEPDRALMAEILDRLLRPVGTVPVVALHGEASASLIAAIEEAVLPVLPGLTVASRAGVRQGGHVLSVQDASTLEAQRPLLRDPAATALLLEIDGHDLCSQGFICATIDLLILSESGSDPLLEPWRSWLSRSAKQCLCCDPSGPDTVTSLEQAQHLAVSTLIGVSG